MADEDMPIILDTDKATDLSYLIETRERVLLQHGGSVTQMQFSEVKQMTLDWWLEHEVPKLRKLDRTLLVLRDTMAGSITLMTGDQVLQYKLDNISEVGLKELTKLIAIDSADEIITPNLPYVLVAKIRKGGKKSITVELPSRKVHVLIPMMEVSDDVWFPPCWFRVDMSEANAQLGGYVAFVPERALNWDDTRLCKPSLPNTSSDGRICFGNTVVAAKVDKRQMTEAEVVHATIAQFFESEFNNHLLYNTQAFEGIVSSAWPKATQQEKWMAKKGWAGYSGLMKYLCCMADEGAWRRLHFETLSQSVGYGTANINATQRGARAFVGL